MSALALPCTCREVGDRLSEFLDDELGLLDQTRLLLHLSACPRCESGARRLAETVRVLHDMAGWADGRPACRLR